MSGGKVRTSINKKNPKAEPSDEGASQKIMLPKLTRKLTPVQMEIHVPGSLDWFTHAERLVQEKDDNTLKKKLMWKGATKKIGMVAAMAANSAEPGSAPGSPTQS